MMKKWVAGTLVLVLLLSLVGCGNTSRVAVDYGSSSLYSTDDMDRAVVAVKKTFAKMQGCTLHTLSYAGDERSESELAYCKELDAEAQYDGCIVFNSSFRSPKNGGGAWQADEEYTWSWTVARNSAGQWILVNYGYG